MKNESWIERALKEISTQARLRKLTTFEHNQDMISSKGQRFINFSSNDYLNLSRDPDVIAIAQQYLNQQGCGATASRLVSGTGPYHSELDELVAQFKEYPAALTFGSGYLVNLGTITALMGRKDHIFVDRLSHASIIDAALLSRATVHRFNHNDPDHLEKLFNTTKSSDKKLVITESVFSMDGDIAPLQEIVTVGQQYGAMIMVDEAHATGVFGIQGKGVVHALGLEKQVNISMGTFSKALGAYGGYVACSNEIKQLLINRARSFIYTTALPPSVIGSILGAIRKVTHEKNMGEEVLKKANFFREKLSQLGLPLGNSQSQIIPIIVGDSQKALDFSNSLREVGILAIAIRPPTVPVGSARLRFSVTRAHSYSQLEETAQNIYACAKEMGLL